MRRATDEEKALAARLRGEGLSFNEIGRRLGRSHRLVQYWLNPAMREKHRLVEHKRRQCPETRYRMKLMEESRIEANARGVPVSQVRQEWGIE